jgi:hypothetical protein
VKTLVLQPASRRQWLLLVLEADAQVVAVVVCDLDVVERLVESLGLVQDARAAA